MLECSNKFQVLIDKNNDLMITHKEFKDLLDNDDVKICKLNHNFRKKTVGWNQFEKWLSDRNFDSDKFD